MDRKERMIGCFYGLAYGDILGSVPEGMSKGKIQREFGIIDGVIKTSPGDKYHRSYLQVTDDTQMAFLALSSILEKRSLDIRDLTWRLTTTEFDGAGVGTKDAIAQLREGVAEPKQLREGNSPALRSIGLAIGACAYPMKDVSSEVRRSTMLTHSSEVSFAASLLTYKVVDYLLKGKGTENLNDIIMGSQNSTERKFAERVRMIKSKENLNIEDFADLVGTSSNALESVPFALFAFLSNPNNPHENLIEVVNQGGDTDSNCAMVGAYHGAMHGLDWVPKEVQEKVEQEFRIRETLQNLDREIVH